MSNNNTKQLIPIRLGGENYPLGIVQEIEIWPYYQMLYTQTRICPGKWDTHNSLEFCDTINSPNPGQKTIFRDNSPKADLVVSVNYSIEIKDN